MSRIIKKIIKEYEDNYNVQDGSVTEVSTVVIDGHEVEPWNPIIQDPIHGNISDNQTGPDHTGPSYEIDDGTSGGSPGASVRPYDYDESGWGERDYPITVKRLYSEVIRDFTNKKLQEYQAAGGIPYAIMKDDTKVQVNWSDVRYVKTSPSEYTGLSIAQIAASKNQNFWTDSDGAHITSDLKDSWVEEYEEPEHGTLAAPTLQNPWHNILLNSLGILLRKGLINLASMESGSIAFYDGEGNNASNINAVFGSQGAQIGKSTEKHLILDNTGLNAYDEHGELAPVRASNIAADHADIETLKTGKADIDFLTTNYALITDLTASNAKINNLSTIILSAVNADIDNLTADEIAATNISALNAALAHIEAGSATIQDLNTVNAFIEMIAANRITTNYLAANYADINLANVDTEWLDHGIIKEASISDAMIVGVSANKLTAGEIDASKIRVSNLMANNILVNMINNVPVNGATVADALMVHDNDINNINVRLDDELSALNARVDSQIETFTLSAVPTLNNQPANEWLIYLTDSNNEEVLDSNNEPILVEDLRRSHVGDIAYVLNPGNEADGYSYRFMYDNTAQTYSWTLIKDTQITDVIQRLIDAEGKIDGLETFESTTSQWIDETDQGIRTIRQNVSTITSNLEEANRSIASKVDTSTFQEIVDEVNEQSSTITTLTTSVDTINNTIDDLATASSVTTVTNLVNQVKQTADTNSASIKSLETTTSDLYGVSDTLIERVSSLNQSLDGFNTKVSNIYSDITDTNKSLNQLKATYAICYTAANTSSKTADSMLSYLIDSNGDYVLDSSNNKIELLDTLDNFILRPGNKLSCTFINENTAANPTLNINGTDAKPILSYSGQSLSEDEYKWKANSTFEFIYDGSGWRLQDSGSIKRLSAAETKIDQNAQAITLSATKTEVKQSIDGIQIGGRNLAKVTDQILSPTEYSGLTMYLSSPLEVDEKYILQLWDVDISHSGRTNDFNLAIYYCGGSVRLITFDAEYFNEGHADYMMAEFTVTSSMVSAATVINAGNNKFIRFYNSVPSTSGTKNLTIGKVKLEKGTKPSDWTPAPEDMQSIEQAAAELKVTNEAITAKVSKTDYTGNTVVSMINQTAEDIKIQAKHVEVDGLAVFTNREFKESFDSKINELSSYVESIGTDLAGYINSNENALKSLNMLVKNQTDSQVDVWYYSGEPNLTGMPYNSWLYLIDSNEQLVLDSNGNPISVEDTRAEHIGDLYFDSVTGYSYRFAKDNNTYIWDRIKDNDITGALHAAQDAQATADKKRRIFTTTPTVPYDIGDLWVNGNNVKYATVKKTSAQAYSSNDWVLTATDDSMAKENIKDTVRLWSFGHSRVLPDPPSQAVTTENPFVDGWSVNPVSFSDLPPDIIIYYFYCDQYQKGDGSYGWSEVVYDAAITEAHQLARTVQDELSSYIIKNDLMLNSLKIDLKNQTDSQVDIWYFAATPDFNNAPYNGWLYLTDSNNQTVLDGNGNPISVEDTRANHVGDLYFDTATGYSYRFDSMNGTYVWTKIQDKDIGAALSAANDAQTTADNKRRIFTATPTVPYDIGDLWVNGTQVKYANKARATGSFTNSDWVLTATDDTKANSVSDTLTKYMSSNNTALNTLQQSLQGQIDSQVDIWYYSGEPTLTKNPASSWSDTATRDKHIGDLYFDTSKGYAYRFIKSGTTYSWSRIKDSDITSALSAANTAQTTADNKRRIFTATPTVPYDIGDLWVNGTQVKYANKARATGSFTNSDWVLTATDDTKANSVSDTLTKYMSSNNTALNTLQQSLQGQIDSQVDIWYYSGEPTLTKNPASSWSDTATRDKHIGDLYFDTSKGYAYRFIKSGTTYSWSRIKDSDITSALSAANTAQTTADNKRRIFTATPTVPYDIGDLWVNGDEVKYATVRKTTSQTYSSSDWALTATDDTMASKGIKTRTKLWYIKSNSTAPAKPTSKITSSSTDPNGWRTVIPDYNDSYPYYFYCYQDEKANGDVTWSDVIYDKNTTSTQSTSRAAAPKTTAVKRQQRIYYRSSSNVKPTAPSTWVTKTSDSYSSTYDSSTNWTIKYSQLTYNDVKYPYMWTCLQSETVSEQITNSPVLLDDSTLVIDGGNIMLGSIAANRLDIEDINVANKLTIGAFNSATQGNILNSTYVTDIDGNGIKIHSKNDDVSNFNQIDGTGTAIYRGGKEIAKFGSEITLGGNGIQSTLKVKNTGISITRGSSEYAYFGINSTIGSSNSNHLNITEDGVDVYNSSTRLAHYGDEIILGDTNTQASLLNSSGMTIYKSGNEVASFGDEIVLGSTSNQGSRINSNGMQIFKGGRQVASFGNDITIGVPNNGAYTYLDNNSYRISWNKNGSFRVGYTRIAGGVITESIRVTKESDKLHFNLAYYTTYIRTLRVSGFILTNDNSLTIDGVYQGTPPSHDIYTNISIVDPYSYAYLHSRISIDLTKINQYYERDYGSDFIVDIEYSISNDDIRMPYLELGEVGFTTHPVCSIISGSGNRITEYVQYSLIVGTGNSVTSGGATDPNIAVGIIGSGNIIEYDTGCTFINGRSNRINRRSNYVFINGLGNEVETYADNVFINGSYNRADGRNTFISGTDNEAQGFSSLLGWGLKTPETASFMQGALICGRDNKVVDNLVFCVGNGTYTNSTGRSNAFVLLGDGTAYINGSNSSNGSTVTSDKRIKTLIADISPEEGNKFISSLKPRKYYKKTSNGQEKQVGFYAQDIEEDEDFGEYLVSIDNSGNYDIPDFRLLNYQGIIAPLVASVQYLQQENEQLKQKNQELEDRLARLEELLLNR